MKYVDLHAHLGSTVSIPMCFRLAHEQGLRLSQKDYFEFKNLMEVESQIDHKKYLKKFELTHLIQNSPSAIEKSVYESIFSAYTEQYLKKIEIRFNPFKRNGLNKEYDVDAVILSAIIGMKKATAMFDIKCGLILETDRQFTSEQSEIIFTKAAKFINEGVVGVDMSGFSPKNFSIKTHQNAFDIAHKFGLNVTCHTGEVTDHKEMNEIIDNYLPQRIGHGIACVKDKHLLKKISSKGIILEICPTSNVKTGVVKSYKSFKEIFKILNKHDVMFTINSDGWVFLKNGVKDEFQKLLEHKVIVHSDIEKLTQIASVGSFV
jgi:adenosine deaminase